MEVSTRKQRPHTYRKPINPEMEQKIMNHFWTENENEASAIAMKFGLDKQKVCLVITKNLNNHFNQIKKRVNKKL